MRIRTQSVGLKKRYTGFSSRANLTWHVTDDALAVLHLVAGLPSGRIQPRVRIRQRRRHRR